MARKALCITGGVIMLISVCIPVFYTHLYLKLFGARAEWLIFYWMFGYYYAHGTITEYTTGEFTKTGFFGGQLDVLGLICMVIIIFGAIVAIATSGKKSIAPFIGGILGLLGMLIYFTGVYYGVYFEIFISPISELEYFYPFIGFYVCMCGSILPTIGGLLKS